MSKKGVALDYLPWLIIGLSILVIIIIAIAIMKDQGAGIISNIKEALFG